MRAMLLALGLVAVTACQREPTPSSQPNTSDVTPKSTVAAPSTIKPEPDAQAASAPATPIAEDTSSDTANHRAGAPVTVMLTAVESATALENGTSVSAHFTDARIACRVGLKSRLVSGQAGEGQLICEQALNLSNGAFEFSLHADGRHVADGVVLQ